MTGPTAGTQVAKREQPTTMDLTSAKASVKFLDAYNGRLDKMSEEQKAMFLLALGQRLGVRAELGELILYQGKPYISIDGRIRLAHETGLLVGMETRPATALECRNYGCEPGDVLWVAQVFRRGAGRAFTGWGHVSQKDRNPVTKTHPREMAKKRAKYDALRSAFPPAEHISNLHEKYIEEAEDSIRQGQAFQNQAFAALSSGMDDTAEEVVQTEGHEAAASSEPSRPDLAKAHRLARESVDAGTNEPEPGELPLDQPATKKANTNALAQP
jgi:hypothetical protein